MNAPAGLDLADIPDRIQSEVQRAIQRSIKGVEYIASAGPALDNVGAWGSTVAWGGAVETGPHNTISAAKPTSTRSLISPRSGCGPVWRERRSNVPMTQPSTTARSVFIASGGSARTRPMRLYP